MKYIEFRFTEGTDTVKLASAEKPIDLSNGNKTLSFSNSDYNTTFDDDSDGASNLDEIINKSINETLSRTLLTSTTTLVVVVALFVLGGGVIHDFAFAILIGILVGTYSSIFVASPIILVWESSCKERGGVKKK